MTENDRTLIKYMCKREGVAEVVIVCCKAHNELAYSKIRVTTLDGTFNRPLLGDIEFKAKRTPTLTRRYALELARYARFCLKLPSRSKRVTVFS